MQARAALATAAHQPLEIVTLDVAPPQAGEVLIRMKATGLCASDLGGLNGKAPRYPFPMVLGHEGAGEVIEVGPGVTAFQPGDQVIPSALPECGVCKLCLSGKTNMCVRQAVNAPSRLSYNGQEVTSFCGTATFAEYAVIQEMRLSKVRADAPADTICYVGCGVITGVGAVLNTAQVKPGSSVVVFGLGGIGLNVIQGARIAGASRIIGVDINAAREGVARKLGATDFIYSSEVNDAVARVRELTGGLGADYAFECVGSTALARAAMDCTNHAWGMGVAVGIPGPGQTLDFQPMSFLTGRTWKGSILGGERPKRAVPDLVDWYMDGFLNIDDLITHRIVLDEVNHGFDMMKSGEAIRSVIVF